MILTDTLINVLYLVLIVAVVLLAAVLWRMYAILGDVKKTTERIDRRSKQIDEMIDNVISGFKGGLEAAKGFFYSLDFIKAMKKKINNIYAKEDDLEEKE